MGNIGLGGQPTQVYQPNDAHGTEGRNLHSHAVFAAASRVSRRTPPLPPSAGIVVLVLAKESWATYGAARTFYVATSSNDETPPSSAACHFPWRRLCGGGLICASQTADKLVLGS